MIACPEWAKPLFGFAKCDARLTPGLNRFFSRFFLPRKLRVAGCLGQGERRGRNDQVMNLPKKMVYRSAEQPRCRRHYPLDRWLCVPTFRWVCPLHAISVCKAAFCVCKLRKTRENVRERTFPDARKLSNAYASKGQAIGFSYLCRLPPGRQSVSRSPRVSTPRQACNGHIATN